MRAEVFVDDRGNGLRVSHHDADGVIVFSVWRGDVCVATARLDEGDGARLSAFLDTVLKRAEAARSQAAVPSR